MQDDVLHAVILVVDGWAVQLPCCSDPYEASG